MSRLLLAGAMIQETCVARCCGMSNNVNGQDIASLQVEVLVVLAWSRIPFSPCHVVGSGDVVLFDVVTVEA